MIKTLYKINGKSPKAQDMPNKQIAGIGLGEILGYIIENQLDSIQVNVNG